MLTPEQLAAFRAEGYLIVRDVVGPRQLAALSAEIDRWVEESRGERANYGRLPNGKARFDLEEGHSAERPLLRRVANPCDISAAYREVLWTGAVLELVADLIGPDIKFHHCKLNLKMPGMKMVVGFHQDQGYDPHTNDDVVTAVLLLDEMGDENGCLRVVPGSHTQRHSLYDGDRFAGMTSAESSARFLASSVAVAGRAGDVCLMDSWTVHGSGLNASERPRRLLICEYSAADAFALAPPHVPSDYSGRVIHGRPSRFARMTAGRRELPRGYSQDSIFGLQGQKSPEEG
jgi:ectoine hydroxylase-related dioxygenase (phytanoyl-CoA dioxygenase family)